MAKLKLNPDPTFKAKVRISVAGADEPVEVEFTFKHRTKDELQKFIEASASREDADNVLEMASGWELADAFTREAVDVLAQNYITAPRAIFDRYIDELVKAREKN
ncbi:MAG: phage tail assembly chaperone [Solimonas sp.]